MNPTIKRHSEEIIGYKALKKDEKGYYTDVMGSGEKTYFEVGKVYKVKGKPELCKNGLHFFRHYCFAIDYLDRGNIICKVRSLGEVEEDTEKCVTNKLEILAVEYTEDVDGNRNSGNYNSGDRNSGNCNSGYRNSGDCNSGNCNSGNYNSGYRNSGNCNSGYYNSGDYNSGYYNSGYRNSGNCNSGDCNSGNGYINSFCTETRYFLYDVECSREEWESVQDLDMSWFDLSNGYKKAWEKAPKEVIKKIKSLKNFDAKKFKEITGLDVRGKK